MCLGQDLGKQVQQLCPFAGGQGGQDAPLDGADPGGQLAGGGAAVGGDLDRGTLRRSPGLGTRKRRESSRGYSSRSSVAVMVAEATRSPVADL